MSQKYVRASGCTDAGIYLPAFIICRKTSSMNGALAGNREYRGADEDSWEDQENPFS
jgi:hypothetical protein